MQTYKYLENFLAERNDVCEKLNTLKILGTGDYIAGLQCPSQDHYMHRCSFVSLNTKFHYKDCQNISRGSFLPINRKTS